MTFTLHHTRSAGRVLTLLSLIGVGVATITPAQAQLITLASFNYTNGSGPSVGMTIDSSGNLYGTADSGGAFGNGVVYEIAKGTHTITDLASFNGTNGNAPNDVTFDSSGNLFGTTQLGGASNAGVVYEIAKGTHAITDLASFTGGSGLGTNGGNPFAGVTFDSRGNLFGTTLYGGASANGTVYEIAKGSNAITDLASFTGDGAGTNGGSPYAGVTFDSSGNLYGTTGKGGAYGYGTVYEIAGAGSPVPEISTMISFALLLGLGGVYLGILSFRKRRQTATPEA